DGALQKGVPWPTPRFTDNNNGTITDNLTGLIWLKDAGCLGLQTLADALAAANTLADGNAACALSDGSVMGDWRLPNVKELMSLLDFGRFSPALPAGHPFINFAPYKYRSSTMEVTSAPIFPWIVDFNLGRVGSDDKADKDFVTAVRGGS